MSSPRPADLCRSLLLELDGSEERRRRRLRDTTPDALGLSVRRSLLESAVAADPAPADFERWLFRRVQDAYPASGPLRAAALEVAERWRARE